jgi:3-hydroxyisobutyrate dehydrogenase
MAKNMRQKIPKEDTLYVQDVNSASVKKFIDELSDHSVVVAASAREVAEKAVS